MNYRQYATYLITLVFAGLFSCANPTEPASSQFTVTIKGTVVRKNFTPLDSVQIILSSPFRRDSAKADGSFLISFSSSEKNAVNATMTFSRLGFFDTTRAVSFSSTVKDLDLQAVQMKGLTASQDSGGQSRPSLRAGAIVYIGSSFPNLSIYGAGGTDAVTLTFEVRDSVGNPVDTSNQTLVYFRFADTPPDTFTQLSRKSVKTNSSGRATVILGSGLRAGIASVQAYAAVKQVQDTTKVDTIRSPLASIPIYGGFPDSSAFSLNVGKVNVAGAVQAGIRVPITAIVGDKYGNPAHPGTVVYFGSTGGIVYPASKATGEDGTISVDLITGNPIPNGGVARVTAQINSGGGSSTLAQNNDAVKYLRATMRKMQPISRAEEIFRSKRSVVKFFDENKKESQKSAVRVAAAADNDVVNAVASEKKRAVVADRPAGSKQKFGVADDDVVGISSAGIKKSGVEDRTVAWSKNTGDPTASAGTFFRSVDVIFSGATQIAIVPIADTSLNILKGGQKTLKFTVSDANGHPLSGGSAIKVSTTGSGLSDVELTGDVDRTIPDTKDPGFTSFTVNAKDIRTSGLTQDELFSLSITVTSDNGNVSRTLGGKLLRSGVSDSGRVARVKVDSTKIDSITVAGGGGVASQSVRFQVLDIDDKPTAGIPVQFEVVKSLGGGEYINPTVATSDASGFIQTTLFSGIRSGLVQLVAKARKDTITVASDPKSIYIRTGVISSIAVINVSSSSLSVKGSGGSESSLMVFEGRDSLGNPIDASNSTTVKFTMQGDTTARISPASAKTDLSTGRVTASFNSGIKAGVAFVVASARSDSVKSSPVQISVSGGPPDSLHFSIGPEKLNIPVATSFGITDKISIVAGDKFGNPAQPGSVISFSTTGGIIQSSAAISADGKASVDLTSGSPLPANGIAVVTAQVGAGPGAASGDEGKEVGAKAVDGDKYSKGRSYSKKSESVGAFSRSTNIVFSGKTTISVKDTVLVPSSGTRIVNYVVNDPNGNPISGGSTITVTPSGSAASDVELSGDISKNIPDTQDKITFTQFKVFVKDKRTTGLDQTKTLSLKIDVASANGNQSLTVDGWLQGSGGADGNRVGSITLTPNNFPDTVVVSGGGGIKSKQVQFKVMNVYNQPGNGIPINFEFTKSVSGGEYLSPVSAKTDSNGLVSVTFNSGIRSGNVQFVARAKRDSLSSITSDVKTIYIRTGSIASIALISPLTQQQLSVRSVGGTESALIIYEGRDSLGNSIDFANQTSISFKLQGDTAGTYIVPNPALTDPVTGRVITTLTSGIRPGVVQVYASAKSDSVKSSPVPFTIASGLPDSAHFTLGVPSIVETKVNFPPASSVSVQVAAGDTFGNPARVGSAVYFSTNTGIIDASGSLDVKGNASVSWQLTVNPKPSDGIGYVTARTVNRWGKFVQDTLRVLLSGTPIISSLDTNFSVAVGSTKQFDFTVSDANLNPLSAGATITISSSGSGASDVALSGDIGKVMPDTKDKAFTKFHAFVRDARTTSVTKNEPLNLTINVTGPNGLAELILKGTLLGTGGGAIDSSVVGRIVLQNPAPDTVVVAGVGGIKSKDALFKVYNTFGLPAKNVLVTFAFSKSLGGGEYLSPTTALSDTGGNVKTTLTSGTGFGEVRIVATGKRDSLTISSDTKVIYIVIPPSARLASQIAFLGATESDIFVAGVGAKENSTLTYEVRDSLGFPIDRNRRVFTTFTVQFFPNTFAGGGTAPVVIPSTDSTDDQGRTRTTVVSGTQAGVVQIVVNIALPGRPLLVSQPVKISVHSGFADQNHFTITAQQINFPGLDKAFITDNITVQVADVYSNPVPQGTAVYFNSAHGSMQTGGGDAGLTDVNGFVTKSLYSANPFPVAPNVLSGSTAGFSRVYARTIGKDSVRVLDSLLILWTGAPIVALTGGPGAYAIPNGGSAGPFTFTVLDRLNHPMSPGATITATADGCTVSGDANVSMPDTQVGGAGLTSFTVLLNDAAPLIIPPSPAPSVLTVTVTHPVYGTYKRVLASGTVN
jgi:hypothetical protein